MPEHLLRATEFGIRVLTRLVPCQLIVRFGVAGAEHIPPGSALTGPITRIGGRLSQSGCCPLSGNLVQRHQPHSRPSDSDTKGAATFVTFRRLRSGVQSIHCNPFPISRSVREPPGNARLSCVRHVNFHTCPPPPPDGANLTSALFELHDESRVKWRRKLKSPPNQRRATFS
jgi:hypothetical protein